MAEIRKVSGYGLFAKYRRPQLKKELPDATFGQISAGVANLWAQMDPEEKKIYNDAAEAKSNGSDIDYEWILIQLNKVRNMFEVVMNNSVKAFGKLDKMQHKLNQVKQGIIISK
jgi:hypothetical protein